MNLHVQPDHELTEEEKLMAAMVMLSQRIPSGAQIALGLNLGSAIAAVEKLFTAHNLPLREELIGELTLWRSHAAQGLKFSQQCDQLIQKIIRLVDSAGNR